MSTLSTKDEAGHVRIAAPEASARAMLAVSVTNRIRNAFSHVTRYVLSRVPHTDTHH